MLLNFTIGFIIPWIFGVWMFYKDKKIILIILPFSSMISNTVNSFGFTFGFWMFKPFNLEDFSALPFDLGLFALLGCALIFTLKYMKVNPFLLVFIFALITTGLETIGQLLDYLKYGNNWNVFYTYFSYLISYVLVYWYYLGLKKLNIF